jgi:hypothetical protein
MSDNVQHTKKQQHAILSYHSLTPHKILACILSVIAFNLSLLNSTLGFAWEISGMIVTPECPPTTGTFTFVGSKFCCHESKTSRVTELSGRKYNVIMSV